MAISCRSDGDKKAEIIGPIPPANQAQYARRKHPQNGPILVSLRLQPQ